MGDLLRDEIEWTTRTFMIEKYTAGQVQPVLLTIGADDLVRVGLRDSIRRFRIGPGLLVLQLSLAIAIDLRRGRLKQPRRRQFAANKFADALRDQAVQKRGLNRNVPRQRGTRHCRKIVDFVRLRNGQQVLEEGLVG